MKLRKQHSLVDDSWFCDRITVQGPGTSAETAFPCYRWVQGKSVLSLPEGTGEPAALGKWEQGLLRKCWGQRSRMGLRKVGGA